MTLLINYVTFILDFLYIYIIINSLLENRLSVTLRKMLCLSIPCIFFACLLNLSVQHILLSAVITILCHLILLFIILRIPFRELLVIFTVTYILTVIIKSLCLFLLDLLGPIRMNGLDTLIANFILVLISCLFYPFLPLFPLSNSKRELEAYKAYLPVLDELINCIRMRQHDFHNHLQSIQMLPLNYPDYESLSNALLNYIGQLIPDPRQLDLLKLNYHLVSGLLINKYTQAENRNQIFYIEIKQYSLSTRIPEYILVEILGILIDNALEACPEQGCINLLLDTAGNKIHCIIKNDCLNVSEIHLPSLFDKGYTTKVKSSADHGIGLYKLKKLVDTYNGVIFVTVSEENNGGTLQFELFL